MRRSITACDPDVLDTWDFDVFFYTQEQLVAYVALMFVHLGLTTQDVRPRRLHPDSVTARCHCHNHVLKKAVVISPMYRGVR